MSKFQVFFCWHCFLPRKQVLLHADRFQLLFALLRQYSERDRFHARQLLGVIGTDCAITLANGSFDPKYCPGPIMGLHGRPIPTRQRMLLLVDRVADSARAHQKQPAAAFEGASQRGRVTSTSSLGGSCAGKRAAVARPKLPKAPVMMTVTSALPGRFEQNRFEFSEGRKAGLAAFTTDA